MFFWQLLLWKWVKDIFSDQWSQITFYFYRKRCFTGQFYAKLSQACHPYLMDFLKIFSRGRYDTDMKTLEILGFNSKEFRVYGITNCRLMMIRGWGDHQTQNFHRWLEIISGPKNSPGYLFWLKKLKNDIKIALKPTGIKL